SRNYFGQNQSQSHTEGKGTFLYAAPEQLNKRNYNYKVDIFALGLIVMQFQVNFSNENELFNAIKLLREKRKLPQSFEDLKLDQLIIEKVLILSMTEIDPKLRPKIEKVIEMHDIKKSKNVETDADKL